MTLTTKKTYPHGTRAAYVLNRCRCDACRDANRRYAVARERRLTLASFGCADPLTVEARQVRSHLRFLQRAGVGLRQIAKLTGVSRTTLTQLRSGGSKRATWRNADVILGICSDDKAAGRWAS
jgi:transcriptional regulator with XRE-family HTH domain